MRTPTPLNVASNAWTAVRATGQCSTLIVCETGQAGTTDYYISETASDTDKKTVPAGKEYPFPAPRHKGNGWTYQDGILFYLKTQTGSVTFDVMEV